MVLNALIFELIFEEWERCDLKNDFLPTDAKESGKFSR